MSEQKPLAPIHHVHTHDHSNKNLKTAFILNLAFTLLEIVGGLYVNSVAILSDAIHDLGDSLSLGSAWYLNVKSKQAATKSFPFGYRRFSLLGALINSVVLIIGSIYVVQEAVGRLITPEHSNAQGMIIFAVIGVLVNGYAAWKMSSGKTLNERVVSWHLLEDVLGWFAVLIVAIVLLFKDIPYLDPALSLLITAYILWNVVKRLKETLLIFLQGQPKDVDRDAIEREILNLEHVKSLHHTHIWSLDGEHHVFTTHVRLGVIRNLEVMYALKVQLSNIMKKYPFEHYTIQTEFDQESCELDDKK
jgi:cobalt-zinc-cadmium efflux system protein